ncbi:MAG: methyltransferase domain-containing protein [Hydrogenophaga sp.]|uniref:class I SAM-dependent methyltransferase n=1 Tax=Hydrogenophaga sp. TaxID=1904254 RepID=UPI0026175CE6|nr:methyltransferase domain-containing protein [Hydrogenophaga sp.]MCV0440250.1 methyltransferase domain-containing protein [Hydrogenophaga sp.]
MDPRLQRRVQRYGWDLAADDYEALWQAQLAQAQARLLAHVALQPGEQVLDVACGTGLVSLRAAQAVRPGGQVTGVDLSARMVEAAEQRAQVDPLHPARFLRMDAEQLDLADGGFDVALCAFGLMYLPEPEQAVREMARVVRPGGRIGLAVWGERARCGWSALFPIVDAEVATEVCPLFFRLGQGDALAQLCASAGMAEVRTERIDATLHYASGDEACRAAFAGGPVALAWSRFGDAARARACQRYLEAIAPWRQGAAYAVPAEFVVLTGRKPA